MKVDNERLDTVINYQILIGPVNDRNFDLLRHILGKLEFEDGGLLGLPRTASRRAAWDIIEIFDWQYLSVKEIEERIAEIPRDFIGFMMEKPTLCFLPFDKKESGIPRLFLTFYRDIARKFSVETFIAVLMPLIHLSMQRPEGGVTFKQFEEVAQARHSHMKDMPVEWIVEVTL